MLKGVILHGGSGTRLRPLTFSGPKQLIPVANKPISQYVLEDLRECGINEIAIILGNIYPEKVMDYYGDGSKFDVKITYIRQGEPKGIAHAISLCREFIGSEDFVVYLGDNLLQNGIREYMNEFLTQSYDGYVLLKEVEDPTMFGVAKLDERGILVDVIEKPKQPPSNYAVIGVYLFKPVVFDVIKELKPSWRGEYEVTDTIRLMMQRGYKIGHGILKGWWFDTGKASDILVVNAVILDERAKREIRGEIQDSRIEGRVSVGEGTRVIRSTVRGPCVIGNDCLIEGSFIGPCTSIGNGVTIRNSSVEYSIIQKYVTITNVERLEESLIGEHANLTRNQGNKNALKLRIGDYSTIEL